MKLFDLNITDISIKSVYIFRKLRFKVKQC